MSNVKVKVFRSITTAQLETAINGFININENEAKENGCEFNIVDIKLDHCGNGIVTALMIYQMEKIDQTLTLDIERG